MTISLRRRPRAALAVLGALAVIAGGLALTAPATEAVPTPLPRASSTDDSVSTTKTVTRDYYPSTSSTEPVTSSNKVTVKVDRHTDLQSRERLAVSWSGAHPTGGRAGNPYGEKGIDQEYPVAIFECRGVDDPDAPAADRISPDTCWTNTIQERSQSDDADRSIWRDDRYADPADTGQVSGVDEDDLPDSCPTRQDSTAYHYTPFRAANGTFYAACDAEHLPPEAAVGSVDPPNEVFAYTGVDGKGTAQFEVRTKSENESLGCSDKVACTLVVVPIMGLSCVDATASCNKTGAYPPGSRNDGTTGAQQAVSGSLWWSASNWRNRISIPLDFALPPNTCTLLGQGAPVPFYGSELLSQAALQWSPAYCLNKSRFNWQSNAMPDEAAFGLMTAGTAAAAEVTERQDADTGVGYAPTAVSGFGIAYSVDDPSTGLQYGSLKLNARLLAKLLTESYGGDAVGAKRPGIQDNPWGLQTDPEFIKLNPDLELAFGRTPSVAGAALLALSTGSGVIDQLTSYIAHDADAMAFIDGKADPWGMKVNPAYKKVAVPVSTWPLLDTWVPSNTGSECLDQNKAPYLPKVAAPVSSLRLIAQAMLFNWPNVQTSCEKDVTTGLWKLGRIGVQEVGQRFMLGLVTLGDAARYGLPVAALQAKKGSYVEPTDKSMSAALKLSKQSTKLKPFELDQADIRTSPIAYPGTMVVYTAAKTYGLDQASAGRVAQFIQVSSTEGQTAGRGNGKLPDGYLPIAATGATAPLYRSAQEVRTAVLAQKKPSTPASPSPTDGASAGPGGSGGPIEPPSTLPTAPVPSASTSASPTAPPTSTGPITTADTARVSSSMGGGLLPFLLVGAVLAGVVAVVTRLMLGLRGVR
ncbi:hypothetical protein [Nocardioides conyzicola]|uniref:PBP domain-containing protein n=1 Tax=Nocardioides conyzicola TaxID=1651781 RepID=A0ABP8XQV0_9ACTN